MSTTTSILDDLIQTLKDGEEGFIAAASDIPAPDIKALLTKFSKQRAQFAVELQDLAHNKGETHPEDSGSAVGAIHRSWIDLKAALASNDQLAILAECERGEDSAVATFRKAIESGRLSVDALAVVRRQANDIKDAHDRIRTLRDAAK